MNSAHWNFLFLARVFVPAGLSVAPRALAPLPYAARYELVAQGQPPRRWPDDTLGLCFDFLLHDGSRACSQWLQGLMHEGVLDSMTFLLHEPQQALAALRGWGLPRLACDPQDAATWQALPQALFQALEGEVGVGYGDLRAALARGDGRLQLLSLAAGSPQALRGKVAAALAAQDNTALRSGLVIARAASLDTMAALWDAVTTALGGEVDLLLQGVPGGDDGDCGLTLLLCHGGEAGVIAPGVLARGEGVPAPGLPPG